MRRGREREDGVSEGRRGAWLGTGPTRRTEAIDGKLDREMSGRIGTHPIFFIFPSQRGTLTVFSA